MANHDDLEKLSQGPKVWNAWREEQRGYIPDLRNANLSLSQRQLGPSNGGPVNLEDSDLEGAELRNATLTGANLSNARLTGADLSHSRLDRANLASADLTNACLDHADLTGADLTGAVLIGTSMTGVKGVTEEQLAAAYGDASTIMPGTIPPPASWFPAFDDDDFTHQYPVPEPEKATDLYQVLGVARIASAEDIRSAFRNLVKKLHPDINPGDAAAQEAFKKVSSAYRILNDPVKRARYDRGEIDSDGETSAEYEAKRHFRRYAFRFYLAAAASLFMAVGTVGSLWYSVLQDNDGSRGRVELVIEQPKNMERLTSNIAQTVPRELNGQNAGSDVASVKERARLDASTSSPTPELAAKHQTASSQAARADDEDKGLIAPAAAPAETAGPSGQFGLDQSAAQTIGQQAIDEEAASAQASEAARDRAKQRMAALRETIDQGVMGTRNASIPSGEDNVAGKSATQAHEDKAPPGAADPDPRLASAKNEEAEGHHSPLREAHNGIEAAPAQGDTARSTAPSNQAGPPPRQDIANAAKTDAKGEEASRSADGAESVLMRQTQGRRSIRDPISDLFRGRAVKRALSDGRIQSTASIEAGAAAKVSGDQEEIWDLYTHSIPESEQNQAHPWPENLTTAKVARAPSPALPASSPVSPVATGASHLSEGTQERGQEPPANLRKQAVSDILSGGL